MLLFIQTLFNNLVSLQIFSWLKRITLPHVSVTFRCFRNGICISILIYQNSTYTPSLSNVAELGLLRLFTKSSSLKLEGFVALQDTKVRVKWLI